MSNAAAISPELILFRYRSGFKLISPDKITPHPQLKATGLSVSAALQLPLDVYFYSTDQAFLSLNEHTAQSLQLDSPQQGQGRTPMAVLSTPFATILMENNLKAMKYNTQIIVEERADFPNTSKIHALSFKSPCYGENDKLLGVFGYSIIESVDPLADSLTLINKFNLQYQPPPPTPTATKHTALFDTLTKREIEILGYVMRGETAKSIARKLNLSARTVETFIANIKKKLNVNSKTALIDLINTL